MSAASGSEIARLPLDAEGIRAPYWVIHRADLQAALRDEIESRSDIELRLGCQFEDVSPHAKGLTVIQRSGATRQQELAVALIGADGIWSAVRHHLLPEAAAALLRPDRLARHTRCHAAAARIHLAPGSALDGTGRPPRGLSDFRRAPDQRGCGRAGTMEQAGLERTGRRQRDQERIRRSRVARHSADADQRRRRLAEMGAVYRARQRPMDRRRGSAIGRRRPRHAALRGPRRGHGDRGCSRSRQVRR